MARRIRNFGVTLTMVGLLVVGMVGWQVVGTNQFTQAAQAQLRSELSQDLSSAQVAKRNTAAPLAERQVPPGRPFGMLSIPGISVEQALIEDATPANLKRGPARIASTKLPGQRGTFALSGHRTTYGAPFGSLDRLRPGHTIRVQTRLATYTYTVTKSKIVTPNAISVLGDVRNANGQIRPQIVLTTCHPKFSAKQRLIVFGDLTQTQRV